MKSFGRIKMLFLTLGLALMVASCKKEIGTGNRYNSQREVIIPPKTWTLTTFALRAYPLTDNGDNWDWTDGGPDIYFKVYNSNGGVLYTSATKYNVTANSLPLTWSGINLKLTDLSKTYTVRFYDQDGVLDPDDYMGGFDFWFNANDSRFGTSSETFSVGSFSMMWYYNWGY